MPECFRDESVSRAPVKLAENATELKPSGKSTRAVQARKKANLNRPKTGVLFQGFIFDGSGYAEETWVEALGLHAAGINLQIQPLGRTKDDRKLLPADARARLTLLTNNQVDLSGGVFYMCTPPDMFDVTLSGKYRVGRTMFETDRIPDGWTELCQTMDEIWVPCQFNVQTFSGAGVDLKRLKVVHPGVDTNLFRPGVQPMEIPQTRGFNFLSVFDWHLRKGYDILLRAYFEEFRRDEDVSLVLKTYQINDPASDLQARLAYFIERTMKLRLEDVPPLILVNGFIPQASMPNLYAAASAFVLPSRGEGYGRPFMEALSCGVPVIATKWSGQLEFLDEANSDLVELEGIREAPWDVDMEYYSGHRWAEPSVDDLRAKMRWVFGHARDAKEKAALGRKNMQERFSWDAVIPKWVAEFRRLLD